MQYINIFVEQYCTLVNSNLCSLNTTAVKSFKISGDNQTLAYSYYDDIDCTSGFMTNKAFAINVDKCRSMGYYWNVLSGSIAKEKQTCEITLSFSTPTSTPMINFAVQKTLSFFLFSLLFLLL